MTLTLRTATPDDAEAVMELHLRCHEESYGRHLPAEFFAKRRAALPERTANFRTSITNGHVPTMAFEDGVLVGIAGAGPARGDNPPVDLELHWLYTLARVHGSGFGQGLLDSVLGGNAACLWVLEDNPRAQAFYARNGFVPDGARDVLPEEWHNLPEIRMVRPAITEVAG